MPTVLNQQTAVVDVDSDNSTGSYNADEGKTMGGDTMNDTFDEANDTFYDEDSDAGEATAMEESSSSDRKCRRESSLDQPQDSLSASRELRHYPPSYFDLGPLRQAFE